MLEQIPLRLKATPFHPFEVLCSSGDVFKVDHPENAAVVGHSVTIALPGGESVVTLSALHITGVIGADPIPA